MIAQNKKEKARRKKGVIESDEVDKAILECISDGPISFIDIMRLMNNTPYFFRTTFGLRKRMNALSKNGAIIKVPDKHGHHPKWELASGIFGHDFEAYLLKTEISHFLHSDYANTAIDRDLKNLDRKVAEVMYTGFSKYSNKRSDRSKIQLLINRFGFLILYLFLASIRRSIKPNSKTKSGWNKKKWLKNAFSFEDGLPDSMLSTQLQNMLMLFYGTCSCGHEELLHDDNKCDQCECNQFDLDEVARGKDLELELETLYPQMYKLAKDVEKEQIDGPTSNDLRKAYLQKMNLRDRIRD